MDSTFQFLMGTVFTGMGVATMVFPQIVTELSFNKEFLGKEGVTPPLKLAMQCFGSQASLCGLLILSSKFTSRTYRNFGLAMIPYFIFDFQFWRNGALTNFGAAGDAIGNTIFASCCFLGHCLLVDKENNEVRKMPLCSCLYTARNHNIFASHSLVLIGLCLVLKL